ncbi:MAG: DUF4363 family protein [Oscillospiraceae bacterium]|nr:DUF4363 family protein [Oscillospiraceae bacterium]
MKRIWIGIGLLAALLIGGLWVADAMEDSHLPGAKDLRRASELALEEDWLRAEALTGRAREKWERKWRVTASVADHEPMDEIDGMFEELKTYARARDEVAYSGTCAHLAALLEAMGHAHSFNWWNLL